MHRECGVTLLYTSPKIVSGVPKGIRTPVTAVKGRCPRPLDDGDAEIALQITDLLFLSKMRPSLRGEWHYLLKNVFCVTRTTEWFDSFQASFINNTTLL